MAMKQTTTAISSSLIKTGGTDRELMKRNDQAMEKHAAFLKQQKKVDEDKKKSETIEKMIRPGISLRDHLRIWDSEQKAS